MTEAPAEEGEVLPGVEAAAAERPVSRVLAWVVAGALVCAFVAIDAITPSALERPDEWPQAILLGFCIAQVNLIALWVALAPGNIVMRISWSTLFGTAMWYALILGKRASGGITFSDAVLLGLLLLAALVVLQVPLWIAKKIFCWRLASRAADPHQIALEDRQFHLQHMLLATLPLAIALVRLPQVLPPRGDDVIHFSAGAFTGLAVILLCNLVVTLPCVWWAFVSRGKAVLLAVGWLFYCAVLTIVEIMTFVALFARPPGDVLNFIFLYYVLNVSQCAAVFGTLLIFRAIGFRLVRMPAARREEAASREA